MRKQLVLFPLLLALTTSISGQEREPQSSRRIRTTTRLVALFSDLETQFLSAERRKDQAALAALLAEDFSLWTPAPPGEPIPRAEWMANALATTLESFHLRQMSVQMAGDTAVVNFVLRRNTRAGAKDRGSAFFIVDLWKPAGDHWLLRTRYQSPVPAGAYPSPPRPTGKE